MERMTRRQLAQRLGAVALAAPALVRAADAAGRGRVALAPLPERSAGRLDPAAARHALERAVVACTGAASARAAMARLFRPDDVVGIKLSCLARAGLSPRVELVEALATLLREAGVAAGRIVVFERSSRELQQAGFTIRRSGGAYLCYGVDGDWDEAPTTSGAIGSCFARLVSTACTALVSFGVVKDHDLAGVSGGAKNWYGVIHNPNKYHDNGCDPYVADVLRHPFLANKIRLTLLDGGTAQCHGGPGFRPDATFPLGLLAASTDPLACDAWAWREIDAERQRRGMPTLAAANRGPRFLATAEGYGLGVGSPTRITEVRA